MFYTALRWKTSTLTALQVAEQANTDYFIGIMSGTSMDAIDAVLVGFNEQGHPQGLEAHSQTFPPELRNQLIACIQPDWQGPLSELASLHVTLGELYAEASNHLIKKSRIPPEAISAIGNHGQTIRHRPLLAQPFTLQIGCCQTLATLTNIRVVGQFRRKDMALGGQGAPLVPAFHQTIFRETASDDKLTTGCDVFVVNIGGITNITFLPASKSLSVIGYDTGTGNALLDDWFKLHHPQCKHNYDKNGDWAAKGTKLLGVKAVITFPI